MDWRMTLEILGVIGGLATLIALFLGPMLYLGAKIDSFRKEVHTDMNEFRKKVVEKAKELRVNLMVVDTGILKCTRDRCGSKENYYQIIQKA